MFATRRATLLAVACGTPLIVLALTGVPASARDTGSVPLSRAAGCASGGRNSAEAACAAAMSAGRAPGPARGRGPGGPGPAGKGDNVRVPGVNGRDRQRIPDGKLCSAGVPRYAGLDLPRGDWPTTAMAPGQMFTFRYRPAAPHRGTFRMYVTRTGWTPTDGLHWADLPEEPFLTATDPPLRDGAYVMHGELPRRTGRHVIYTIWQTSDGPDTYYSCADVDFGMPPPMPDPGAGSPAAPAEPVAPPEAQPPVEPEFPAGGDRPNADRPRPSSATPRVALLAATTIALALAAVGAWLVYRRRPDPLPDGAPDDA
ncbi:hypothetical protein Val02_08290 [Virgisporangium aliadipatigenens]|uniref:Chitin-binding type-4 domain-containing protein n=1 Tax=Virgisporangium aliadipatigenens TaxID=741659 RepID=A0A8J3YH93_9ACTN|nr:lytic polysaccharide monooxygenase [Virgisporangium aliadipatigenens]GIJ43943.1 hypothetical protein Val02_08290 [Virgisporangium aliadipatigenens]